MSFTKTLCVAAIAAIMAVPALAQGLMIKDAYARSAMKGAPTGAAFMQIINHGDTDDRLIGARSDGAKRTELHTHIETGDGIMKMMEVESGFTIPAGGMHVLKRGGDHVMFMGLTQDLVQGGSVDVTLIFENAGEVAVQIPVDLERQDHGETAPSGHDH